MYKINVAGNCKKSLSHQVNLIQIKLQYAYNQTYLVSSFDVDYKSMRGAKFVTVVYDYLVERLISIARTIETSAVFYPPYLFSVTYSKTKRRKHQNNKTTSFQKFCKE